MAESVESSVRRVVPGSAKVIMLAQTIVIASLSVWIYEEYLNNPYLRAYVNDLFQAEGWGITIVAVAVALAAATTVLFLKNKTIGKKVGAVSTEAKVPGAGSTGASPETPTGLHPVVASLKAELAGAPVPIGAVPVPKTEETTESAGGQPPVASDPTTPLAAATVTTGTTLVLKKAEPEAPAGEKPSQQ